MIIKLRALNVAAHNTLLNNLINHNKHFLVRGTAVIFTMDIVTEKAILKGLWAGDHANIEQQGVTKEDLEVFFRSNK